MYGIFSYILRFMVNVGKYSIHGASGNDGVFNDVKGEIHGKA